MSIKRGLQRLLGQLAPSIAQQHPSQAAAEAASSIRFRWRNPYNSISSSSLQPRLFSTFRPSRLYPQQYYTTPEDYAFWGIIGINIAGMLATKTDVPGLKEQLLHHCRASVESMYDGRFYTLLTSTLVHTSAWHCAFNLAAFALFRRFARLPPAEMLAVFSSGALAGSLSHTAYYWWDAAGPELGPQYAVNTPALMGCSSGVAAVLAYKLFFEPHAARFLFIVPAPLFLVLPLFCQIQVMEREFCDGPPAKQGAAVVGFLCAIFSTLSRRRVPVWLKRRSAAAGAVQ